MRRNVLLLFFILSFFCAPVLTFAAAEEVQNPKKAKNIILMIGDGMGFNQHVIGAYWRCGGLGKMSYESFPVKLGCTTFCAKVKEEPVPYHYAGYDPTVFWANPANMNVSSYLTQTTDSAAATSAIHSGSKTNYLRLGVDVHGDPLELLAEIAIAAGKSAGAVTTVAVSNATPAGVYSHSIARDRYPEIFLEMTEENHLTVLIGCGHPYYDTLGKKVEEDKQEFRYIGGEETWEKIISPEGYNGFTFVDTARDFEKIAQGKNLPKKLLGITRVQSTMPPIDGTPSSAPVHQEDYDRILGKYSTREIPSLTTMSLGAINVLAQNENGFYLMIEGGAIDHASHNNDTLQVAFEQTGFTKAIDAVVQWVEKNSSWEETVLIITADHDTGFISGSGSYIDKNGDNRFNAENDEFVAFKPVVNKGCAAVPGAQFFSNDHVNAIVPLWGIGAGINELETYVYGVDEEAAKKWDFSGKYIDNVDIAKFLKSKIKK
jgi:alkaline phosphatase